MPRVLVVLHEDTLGGATRAVLRPIAVLVERGWDVEFWCTRPSPLFDELTALGHRVAGAPRLMRYRLRSLRDPPGPRARLLSLPRSLAALRRHLRTRDPELVHVNGRLALPEALVARMSGFRVVAWIHDNPLPGLRGLIGRAGPWVAAHRVLGVSEGHARTLTVAGRRPSVVSLSLPEVERPPRVRRPPGSPLVIGTIGTLIPNKGTDLFVDMAERLHRRGLRADLRIAGGMEASYLAEWGQAQVTRGAPFGVRWLGVTDVVRELSEWDILVMPSRAEAFGLGVLEAMDAGVPVVGTRVGGIAEQLDGGAGVLVDPEDADALADAVCALAAEPQRRAELARRGRLRVGDGFTAQRSADALESAWRGLLAPSPNG